MTRRVSLKRILDDGFGNRWEKCDHEDCALEIVRPGKVQCLRCEYAREEPPRKMEWWAE